MMQPKVSIITVNYNQPQVTCDMLESLGHVTYPNIEIIVVDNASSCDCSMIKSQHPEIKYIASPTNLGFAGGNNIGISASTGDYILLLNNDTIVTPGFLEPMLQTFASNSQIGVVSPKIIFYYTDSLIQYAGTGPISSLTCRGETKGYMQPDDVQYNAETPTHLAHGACMMISRQALDLVGMMDPHYFMYYEEYDYCERIRQAGFQIYYNGTSSIRHKQSVSMGSHSPLKSYYMTRNRIYFARKNFNNINKVISVSYNYCIAIPKNIVKEIFKLRWANALAIIKGGAWHLTHGIQPAREVV